MNLISHCHELHLFLGVMRTRLERLEEAVTMTDHARVIMAAIRRDIGDMDDKGKAMQKEEQAYSHNRGALGHE